jgi:hypothetical protein
MQQDPEFTKEVCTKKPTKIENKFRQQLSLPVVYSLRDSRNNID